MGRSLSFASTACDKRPIQTRFPYGSAPERLSHAANGNSPVHYAKGTPSPVSEDIGLRQLVGAWFQVLFTPLIGVLFIIHSRYLCTIGRDGVLSLGGWAPQLHTEFHEIRATLERHKSLRGFAYGTITLYRETFQTLLLPLHSITGARNPGPKTGLGSSAFARRY